MKLEDFIELDKTQEFKLVIKRTPDTKIGFLLLAQAKAAATDLTKTIFFSNQKNNPDFYTLATTRNTTRVFKKLDTVLLLLEKNNIENVVIDLSKGDNSKK